LLGDLDSDSDPQTRDPFWDAPVISVRDKLTGKLSILTNRQWFERLFEAWWQAHHADKYKDNPEAGDKAKEEKKKEGAENYRRNWEKKE
jgi:hypothetical protein